MTDSGKKIEGPKAEKGFFYIMTNPAQLGLILIGTSARHPEERLLDDDLNGAGVPLPYEIRYYALVSDMKAAFDHVHARIASSHVDKHFYETTTGMAIDAIETAKVEILFRETDVSVHEISSAGRRPEPARLSRGQNRPQTPYSTSLGEQRMRKQQALNRMVGDTPDGENLAPPQPHSSAKSGPAGPGDSSKKPGGDTPLRTEPALVSVGNAASATARAFDRNAVRDLESQSNLDVTPLKEEAKERFFQPEPAEPAPEETVAAPEPKSARVHELRKAPAPTAVPSENKSSDKPRKKIAEKSKPSIDELVEKQATEDAKAESKKASKPAKKKKEKKPRKAQTKREPKEKKQSEKQKAKNAPDTKTESAPAESPARNTPAEKPKPTVDISRAGNAGTPLPIPSLSKRPAPSKPAEQNQPVPQTVAPAGIVYGPQGPVALHPIPGTPYMAVTPVEMAQGQNGGPAQPVIQTIQGPGGITSAPPTAIATMANGTVNAQHPSPGVASPSQPQAALPNPTSPDTMNGLPGANAGNPAQLEAWLNEQDSAADRRSRNRRAVLMSLLGLPVGAIAGGAYVVLNEGLSQNQIGAIVGGAILGAIVLFYLIGRFIGGKKPDTFETDLTDTRDRIDPSLD